VTADILAYPLFLRLLWYVGLQDTVDDCCLFRCRVFFRESDVRISQDEENENLGIKNGKTFRYL
jgi:hypothetical protein